MARRVPPNTSISHTASNPAWKRLVVTPGRPPSPKGEFGPPGGAEPAVCVPAPGTLTGLVVTSMGLRPFATDACGFAEPPAEAEEPPPARLERGRTTFLLPRLRL